MWVRFTDRARRTVFHAQEEAARFGENFVSTEHLLLALVQHKDNLGARTLERLGISLETVKREIEQQVHPKAASPFRDMLLSPQAKRAVDLAFDESRKLHNKYIGTEHLLLGLIREQEGIAGRVLAKLGVQAEAARDVVSTLQKEEGKSSSAAA